MLRLIALMIAAAAIGLSTAGDASAQCYHGRGYGGPAVYYGSPGIAVGYQTGFTRPYYGNGHYRNVYSARPIVYGHPGHFHGGYGRPYGGFPGYGNGVYYNNFNRGFGGSGWSIGIRF